MSQQQLITLKRTVSLLIVFGISWLVVSVLTGKAALTIPLAMLTTAALWKWWRVQLASVFWAKRFAEVIPGRLYRSGQISRYQVKRILAKYNIATVIDLQNLTASRNGSEDAEYNAIRELGIESKRFPMHGNGTGDIEMVAGAVAALHSAIEQGRPVLLHCAAGVQRTGHVLSCYMLLVRGIDPGVLFRHLECFGWQPGERGGWPDQMNGRMVHLAKLLVEKGVLVEMPAKIPQLPLERAERSTGSWLFSQDLKSLGSADMGI